MISPTSGAWDSAFGDLSLMIFRQPTRGSRINLAARTPDLGGGKENKVIDLSVQRWRTGHDS